MKNSLVRAFAICASAAFLSSCFTLTSKPRALVLQPEGTIRAMMLACPSKADLAAAKHIATLDPAAIRLVTWNVHKQADEGWQKDLASLATGNDVVLLQETTLDPAMLDVLQTANLRWVMASSFEYANSDIGVLTAAHVEPVASCTQRAMEPLLRLPKSVVIAWFALEGTTQTLAVANIHAINFSTVDSYRVQLAQVRDALAVHDGPIIFAGDFNTWSDARRQAIAALAGELGLNEVKFADDKRAVFYGSKLDHILVRGLDVVSSTAIEVKSSDHNPVLATLRWPVR
jgi:endonuclease/exonuclease/phosphatase (EEP) superfamily protein YafD